MFTLKKKELENKLGDSDLVPRSLPKKTVRNPEPLPTGRRVFLRSRPRGRAKIQDFYDPEPFVVTKRVSANTYRVKPAGGGQERVVRREHILDDDSNVESEDSSDEFDLPGEEVVPVLRRSRRLRGLAGHTVDAGASTQDSRGGCSMARGRREKV